MKTHKIYYYNYGEMSTTRMQPVRVACPDDKPEEDIRLMSNDDWRSITCQVSAIGEVELPDWLTPEEWIRNEVYWRYTWASDIDRRVKSLPEEQQRFIYSLDGSRQQAAAQLLCAKLRSKFKLSLKKQILAWLADDSDNKFDSPLTHRQWGCLTKYIY